MAPSPTADATRFIESCRTSPAAKTPGTLVSNAYGGRARGQRPGNERSISGPVSTKPCGSRRTSVPSHSVRGDAPMKMNSQLVATSSVTPVSRWATVMVSRCPSPEPATTSERHHTVMFDVRLIRSSR